MHQLIKEKYISEHGDVIHDIIDMVINNLFSVDFINNYY